MENISYSVKTKIRKDKKRKNGTCPIVLQVILNKKILKLSIKGENVLESKWDNKIGRAYGKGYMPLNDLLDKKELEVKNFIRNKVISGDIITTDLIKLFWNGETKSKKNDDFYTFYTDFCRRKKEVGGIRESTFRHYITLEKKLKAFKSNITFNEIDIVFMSDFTVYLNKTNSGTYNMIKFLKCALRDAENLGLTKDTSWKNIKNPQAEAKKNWLTKKEISAIKRLDLKHDPILEEIQNMFLFSCFTGLRHSDVIRLKKQNLKKGAIRFKQHKTGIKTVTPLTGDAFKTIKRYFLARKEHENIFTPFTNTYTNRHLKKIAKMANINRDISYHISRHTFASTLLNEGMDSMLVSKIMGHKKPLQTYNYMHTNVKLMQEAIKGVNFTQM